MTGAAQFAPWIAFLGAIWNTALAVFVLRRNFRGEANVVFFFLGLAIAVWNGCQCILFITNEPDVALVALRVMWVGIACGPVLLLHLSLIAVERPRSKAILWLYGLCFTFACLAFTPLFVTGSRDLGPAGWYVVPGPTLFLFHPVFMMMVISSVTILVRQRKSLPNYKHRQFDALIVAQLLLLGAGVNDVLPIFGFDNYPLSSIPVFPYGSVLAAFYGLIVSYSVLQNQLLDIKISLSRNAAQLTRFAFLSCITLLLLLVAAICAPSEFTRTSIGLSLAAVLISAAIASFLFPRLLGEGIQKLEQRILGDRFDYHDRARSLAASIHLYQDSKALFAELDDVLINAFGVSHYYVFVLDLTETNYSLYHAAGTSGAPAPTHVNAVAAYFTESRTPYLAEVGPAGGRTENLEKARTVLNETRTGIAVPLTISDKLLGVIAMGSRRSGPKLDAADVHVFLSLAVPLSLFINQIHLKDQIIQAQELDLLGRMSRGMAHDLNNLLTPVHTMLQLVNEGVAADQLDDLLPAAQRNVATMRAYIREALFFSQNLRPDFQLGRLDVIVQNALLLVQERAQNREVELVALHPGEARLEIDSILIERLITNLVSNAVDASPPKAKVRVSYLNLPKSEGKPDWWRISIEDAGSGISEENLNRIFTPYFTTKQTGDESRGFGLGLAICRKIVHLHGGSLNVTSRKGSGTSVHVDLPTAQSNDQRSVSPGV